MICMETCPGLVELKLIYETKGAGHDSIFIGKITTLKSGNRSNITNTLLTLIVLILQHL